MKNKFDWYFGPSAEEITTIWDTGILTIDANVLLDLYRYNEKTREDILKAMAFFGDRVWLSGQAAREFIRNRKAVIRSADKWLRPPFQSFENHAREPEISSAHIG